MPINIANTKNRDYSLDRDIKSLSKHFKVQEGVIKKGFLYQEYSFSFPINKGYVVAGRANGPLEALIYKSEDESYTGDYDDIIKISNSNENSSNTSTTNAEKHVHKISTDFGELAIEVTEVDKGYLLKSSLGNNKCSFIVGDSGDVVNGSVKGDCPDILNSMLQHLFSGSTLKMK